MLSCLDPDSFYLTDPDLNGIRKTDLDPGVKVAFKSRIAVAPNFLKLSFLPAFFSFFHVSSKLK
jgi:hypothetical protein